MNIRYLGHSSFLMTSRAGTRIVTDPFGGIGYPFPHVEADVVTVSHGHYDHCNASAVKDATLLCDRAGEYKYGDITLFAVKSFHDDVQGRKRGENLVFVYHIDGLTLCHLGDIGQPASEQFCRSLGQIDGLFVPVGGVYTVDAAGAKAYVDAIRPRFTIPMHFKTPDLEIAINGADEFLGLFPGQVQKVGPECTILPEDLGKTSPILFMERRAKWTS